MADPDQALEVHAREELGVDPANLGSPTQAASASFGSFIVGAAIPLLPWLFMSHGGGGAVVASVVLAAVAAVLIGVVLARFTGRPKWRAALRQLGIAAVSAAIAYGVGAVVGVAKAT
jgi:VIT1/CCC1 family predicted Fe2+/Mn2+ transporter